MARYDALLLVSFGGPEGKDDVLPFLRNVVRGKNVPEERLRLVAERYYLFDGVSPLNGETRRLLEALE
ncbi:MAG TPA: ferrochelatase, partial [Vicinamibacteria bacterium]|nr:ferrochelatase [Vicinamibacteria bacterium]